MSIEKLKELKEFDWTTMKWRLFKKYILSVLFGFSSKVMISINLCGQDKNDKDFIEGKVYINIDECMKDDTFDEWTLAFNYQTIDVFKSGLEIWLRKPGE